MDENTEVATNEELLKAALALQAAQSAKLQSKPNMMSFKGGILMVDGMPVPNGTADVTILAVQPMRAFYDGEYNPAVTQLPACYSYDLEAPHPECQSPQNLTCKGCPKDEWGSKGRGKACKESAKLAVISANAPFETAPMYQASVPVTSITTVRDLTNRASAAGKLVAQYKCRLEVKPDAKTMFKVNLTPVDEVRGIPLNIIMSRAKSAHDILSEPLPIIEEMAEEEAPKGKKKF
jgi:hypothetical protein